MTTTTTAKSTAPATVARCRAIADALNEATVLLVCESAAALEGNGPKSVGAAKAAMYALENLRWSVQALQHALSPKADVDSTDYYVLQVRNWAENTERNILLATMAKGSMKRQKALLDAYAIVAGINF
jgi:hypothetical protein